VLAENHQQQETAYVAHQEEADGTPVITPAPAVQRSHFSRGGLHALL
jgi:hypothetical protein